MILISNIASGQKAPAKVVNGIPVNYDEALVGTYILPNPLMLDNGSKVKDTGTWYEERRPEILRMFEEDQFGKMPLRPADMSFNVFDKGTPAFGGKAIRKQVTVYFTKDTSNYKMTLLIYLPAKARKPVPLLFHISFTANPATVNDSGVERGMVWSRDGKKVLAPTHLGFDRLPVEDLISQGIGVATVYYGDIEPDFKEGIKYGIRSLYLPPGKTQPAPDEWGAISAWAWGLSRGMDYLKTDTEIDARRVALYGVSRLGKTVLWAGAHDKRFAMVIASCSGEGGAALSRRNYGETVKLITDTSRYFYQFCANYHSYSDRVDSLPMDAHMLIALMAPRPLLLQTGNTDYWSDPKGEFVAELAAEPVYQLFGKKGPQTDVMPAAGDTSLLNCLGYYIHDGGHGTLPSDWKVYIEFIKKYL